MNLRLARRLKTAVRALLLDTPLLPRRPDGGERIVHDLPAALPRTPIPLQPVLELTACAVCDGGESTLVSEFNRFALFPNAPDATAARYDYRLCHRCGVAYASRRPAGERYRWLLEHFEETLGRGDRDAGAAGKLTLSAFTLTDAEREELRRRAARGVFVSDHQGLARKDYLPILLADRLASAAHAELLASLLPQQPRRVLEIRSRAGSIGASLQRQWNADVTVLALFENQRFAIEQAYGFRSEGLLDYDTFTIPGEGLFDLIIANHMLTHVVHPRGFLAEIRRRLSPGGHLYVYNEPDDAEYLLEGKSMFNTLNAFHLQAFDGPSLTHALAANGFTVTFLTRHDGNFLCLSRAEPELQAWEPIGAKELDRRRQRYLDARDAAILMMPREAQDVLPPGEWDRAADRAFKAGLAEVREDGQVRVRKRAPKA